MGVVYLATDVRDGKRVALKLLLNEGKASYTQRSRFIREAESAARLDHPGIVRVHDSGTERGSLFIAMDAIEGPCLDDVLDRLKLEDLVGLLGKAARAVGHAHERDIVHRDLKPANIMVRERDGQPVVMDFGLARDLDKGSLTQTGVVMGTPHYLSPEQADDSKRVTPASDVYALGTILYEGLTGHTPFAHLQAVLKLLHAIMREDPRPPTESNHRVPAVLEEICLKALAKNPEDRYPNGIAMAEALEHAYAQLWGEAPVFEVLPQLDPASQATRIEPPPSASGGDGGGLAPLVAERSEAPGGIGGAEPPRNHTDGALETVRSGVFGTMGIGLLSVSLCCVLSAGWCLSGDVSQDSVLADRVATAKLLSPEEAAQSSGLVCVERQVAQVDSAVVAAGVRALHVESWIQDIEPAGTVQPDGSRSTYPIVVGTRRNEASHTVESFKLGPLVVRPRGARYWYLEDKTERVELEQRDYRLLRADRPLTVIGEVQDGVMSAEGAELVIVPGKGRQEFEEQLRSAGLGGFVGYTALAIGVVLLLGGILSLVFARRKAA